ncbi:MAG: T9SS type A sorting domain-containing protein [Bacteroidia bacterium]|nr:T9SS type A sorting domain-containing protein [Bacteroidia bacterium]
MKRILFTLTFLLAFGMVAVFGQDTIMVAGTTGTTTWTKNNVYLLKGYVRVDNGETLTIQEGTIVLADTGALENASALIVERNGKIFANGTQAEPIVFTSLLDNTNDPNDLLDKQAIGLWGGVIICGDASTNIANNGSAQVEGIPSTLPASVGTYGGSTDDDDSGVLRYVTIRHTGVALASNNEIQGLTLAGVGNRTVIENIESYASADDGIEIFGGTVNLKYISIAFFEDDGLDYDQGWRGSVQYLFVLQAAGFGDRLGEWDGADTPEDGAPFGIPTIYNATFIGSLPAGTDKRTLTFRANGGGKVYNSIFTEQNRGVDIEIKSDSLISENSYDRFVAGDLDLTNNIFWNIAGNNANNMFRISPIPKGWVDSATVVSAAVADIQSYFPANNSISDPAIFGLSYVDDGMLDPRFGAAEVTQNLKPSTGFFDNPGYKGAFGPTQAGLWIKGWTALDHYGYLPTFSSDTILVTGTTGNATWTNDKVYLLKGYVRVDNGDTLRIAAGTVVLADTGSLENASALIIERDGYIEALGTEQDPIIFTSLLDNTTDPNDLLDKQAIGLWGGVIVCGDASTNIANNGSAQVEGIPSNLPATVGTYGGNEDTDNSGILRYVSIRHTGIALASNNEIQGLTLAGVGNATVVEHIESYASADDGIEIFGGTVNLKYITISFFEDDGLDYDQGWRGNVQHLFVLQAAGFGDRMGEWDGADTPEDGAPFGIPTIYNATFIGSKPAGTDKRMLTFRANGGGKVYNSILIEQNRGIDVEIKSDSLISQNSYDRFVAGDLDLTNNIFWNIASNTAASAFRISPIPKGWVDSATIVSAAITNFQTYMGNNNLITDPKIQGLSYIDDNGLDPRFAAFEVVDGVKTPVGAFFTPTTYKGAFGLTADGLWVKGWTALDHYGYLVANPGNVTGINNEELISTVNVYPNPSTGVFTVTAQDLDVAQAATITVLNAMGQVVFTKEVRGSELRTDIDLSKMPQGMYVLSIKNGNKVSVGKIIKE